MKGARILVVEDEGIVQMDISQRLIALGYQVVGGAATGEAAIQKAGDLLPDLVLMDIKLKGKMDGIEAAEVISKRFMLPVIFLTAFADETSLQRAQVTEAFGYVLKPFEERELSISIEMALYKHRVEQKLRDSETHMRTIFNTALDGMFVINREGRCMDVNASGCRLFGVNEEEILSADTLALPLPEEFANAAQYSSRLWHEASGLFECQMRRKDGAQIWVEMRTAPLKFNGEEYILATMRDVTDRKRAEEQLLYDAFHDSLTGLANRALFLDRLAQVIEHCNREDGYAFGVLFLDLDQFKIINDSLGHNLGDELLIYTAKLLQGCVRSIDTVARLGGDEFVILLDNITSLDDTVSVTNRIQEALQSPIRIGAHSVHITTSIGVVFSKQGYERTDDILRDADIAMYRAKALGKAHSIVFEPHMRRQAIARLELENELRLAFQRKEFQLYYQPILTLETNQLTGFEALIRWRHPKQGFIPPSEFIPLAEETELIIPIGQWVLREACLQLKDWQSRLPGLCQFYISVNVSGKQLSNPAFVNQVVEILEETGVDAMNLRFEITESALIENNGVITEILKTLHEMGIQFFIDDFGTGYSSLSYIQRFPVNTIKVDRSFIHQMNTDTGSNEMIQSILRFAQNLGLDTVAEGVETASQLEQLKAWLCTYGQGYHISRPLDPNSAEAFLMRSSRRETI